MATWGFGFQKYFNIEPIQATQWLSEIRWLHLSLSTPSNSEPKECYRPVHASNHHPKPQTPKSTLNQDTQSNSATRTPRTFDVTIPLKMYAQSTHFPWKGETLAVRVSHDAGWTPSARPLLVSLWESTILKYPPEYKSDIRPVSG